MADDLTSLADRIDLLEKVFKNHLGPNFAASSMNIPHPGVDTTITALTARVATLESQMTTANTNISTLQTQMTAAQAAIITSGRYN